MGVHARTWFTPKQRAELWERWKNGQCVADIARGLERRNKSGIYRVLALSGGIAPLPRRRAARAPRLAEREEISRGIAAGWSIRRIAQGLARSPSTVGREINHRAIDLNQRTQSRMVASGSIEDSTAVSPLSVRGEKPMFDPVPMAADSIVAIISALVTAAGVVWLYLAQLAR